MNSNLIGPEWFEVLKDEFEKEYFKKLKEELKKEYTSTRCYPDPQNIFKVFQLCPPDKVRVICLSQDPYGSSHASGIAFSSLQRETPYSLQMILREVDRDIVKTKDYKEYKEAFPNNDLTPWVKQGVFLLNVVLTVRAGEAGSHSHLGWQKFTNVVLQHLWKDYEKPKAFLLFGKDARESMSSMLIDKDHPHFILESGHPASGAHGMDKFSGNGFPSKVNYWFKKNNLNEINWKLNG